MAEILGAATSATKFFLEVNHISIDNWTFKLFYKATTTLLLACSVIASSKQFFGDPINCEVTGGGVNDAVLNSYCWMYSTFNIPLEFKGACSKQEHDGTTLYNSYYQWVAIFLVVSAMLFYLPRAIWLMAEGGLMKFLAKGTTSKIVEDADEKRESLIKTFQEHLHNKYNSYAFWFFCCEQLNFFVVLCMWFITNKFLKFQFLIYGPLVVQYYNVPSEERDTLMVNPMCETFPRIAACNYVRYGSGGGQENKNAICILGLNMINDKIFLILWFWYLFLTVFALLRFVYRIIQLSSRHFRYHMMRMKMSRYFKTDANMRHVEHYAKHCSIGDWFVLYQMSRNMNTRFFAEFLVVLSRRVNPCPGMDADDCEFLIHSKGKNGDLKNYKCEPDAISLHSRIVDLTYDSGHDEHHATDKKSGGCDKGEKKAESKKEDEEKKEESEGECYNPKDDRDIGKKQMYRERKEQLEEALKSESTPPVTYSSRTPNVKKMRHDYFHK